MEIEIVLIIHQYKFIFANHISFQLSDFLQLGNFVFIGVLRKRNMREKCKINGQNERGKTKKKNLHVERILTIHVALNSSYINLS